MDPTIERIQGLLRSSYLLPSNPASNPGLPKEILKSFPALREFAGINGHIEGASMIGCLAMVLGLSCAAFAGEQAQFEKAIWDKIKNFGERYKKGDPIVGTLYQKIMWTNTTWRANLRWYSEAQYRAPSRIAHNFASLLNPAARQADFKEFLRPMIAGLYYNPFEQACFALLSPSRRDRERICPSGYLYYTLDQTLLDFIRFDSNGTPFNQLPPNVRNIHIAREAEIFCRSQRQANYSVASVLLPHYDRSRFEGTAHSPQKNKEKRSVVTGSQMQHNLHGLAPAFMGRMNAFFA